MERIVNGHYADPNSTRDIVGITPNEFEALIAILQEKYAGTTAYFELSEEDKMIALAPMVEVMFNNNPGHKFKNVDEVKQFFEETLTKQYNIIYKFLTEINQPYPGADYSNQAGQN